MSKKSRRTFLQQTGLGLAGVGLLPAETWAKSLNSQNRIPAHNGMIVPGVHGYGPQSVAAGETMRFRVSSTVSYSLSVWRLGLNAEDTSADELLHRFPQRSANPQPIRPGSYVYIPKSVTHCPGGLTLECWVRPASLKFRSGLITQCNESDKVDFGLFLEAKGNVSFAVADGKSGPTHPLTSINSLKANRWQHLVATWDGRERKIWLDGKVIAADSASSVEEFSGKSVLRIGAASTNGRTDAFFDGDFAMPVIYGRALTSEEIIDRKKQRALVPPTTGGILAAWPLDEEKGDRISDVSGHGRHGQIINHGTWMIGGPSFEREVSQFAKYEPRKDAERGHGLRLASDDLYDCGWSITHEYKLPDRARSGVYVGRIEYEWEGTPHLYHITFIVKKAVRRKKAPILVLCSTNTWRAYNATPFAAPQPTLKRNFSTQGITNSPGNPPAYCFYRRHAGGQGTYQLGLNMPFMGADPYLLYGKEYSHLLRAERFAQIWLEQAGYDFDVITDLDLHRDPKILRDYKVVLINGHSEYWSLSSYVGLENYLKHDGNVVVLSGNSLFWRVSFNDDCSVIECRKVDAPGEQMKPHERGESWHSQDGQRGGLLRGCGYPGWKLIGLDTLGWYGEPMFSPYAVEREDHFLFKGPLKLGLKNGSHLGEAAGGKMPRANGHEIDVRLSTLASLQEQPTPDGASMPIDPPGIVRLANGLTDWSKGGSAFDYFFRPIKPKVLQGGEMIFWERPDGGKVFNAGSIGSGWALHSDPNFQGLMRNLLSSFGVNARA